MKWRARSESSKPTTGTSLLGQTFTPSSSSTSTATNTATPSSPQTPATAMSEFGDKSIEAKEESLDTPSADSTGNVVEIAMDNMENRNGKNQGGKEPFLEMPGDDNYNKDDDDDNDDDDDGEEEDNFDEESSDGKTFDNVAQIETLNETGV